MKKILVLMFVLVNLIFGCASHSDIVPIGHDSYQVIKREVIAGGPPFPNLSTLKAEAEIDANNFCVNQNKDMKIVDFVSNSPPYEWSGGPTVRLRFMCIEKKSD